MENGRNPASSAWRCAQIAVATLALGGCDQADVSAPAATATAKSEALSVAPPEEFGIYFANPEELAAVPINEVVRSMRLNSTAKFYGQEVYNRNCAECHGADLKGVPGRNAPDLTDVFWRFSGDDADTGGGTMRPSDVEWTVRYGVRSGHEYARGLEAEMVAFDPQYRSDQAKQLYGGRRFLNDGEIADVVEYVMKISGREADTAKAALGEELFHNGDKGNCNDCHENGGIGNFALGSTNLTRPELYLYGSDRAAILESIVKGRQGMMPAFEGRLTPEEIKAVSVFVFYRAAQ